MIKVENLSHTYKTKSSSDVLALNGINITIADKGMHFIVGKSGCGKSTLLNLLGGLDKIQQGDIFVDGVSMGGFKQADYDAFRSSYVGMIFQDFNLLEDLTVYENIELQLKIAGVMVKKDTIENSLKKVVLEGYGSRHPKELSGGERQRVAIARQLAKGAKLLLADEPTGNLDSENAENVFEILKTLSKYIAVVVVSHDLDFAERYADKIITMKDGVIESEQQMSELAESQEIAVYKSIKPQFPRKYTFKFAFKNLFKRKVRLVVSLVLAMLCFGMFSLTGAIITADTEKTIADYYAKTSEANYTVAQGKNDGSDNLGFRVQGNLKINNEFIKFFDNQTQIDKVKIYKLNIGSFPFIGSNVTYGGYGVVENATILEKATGYTMVEGYKQLDINSVYITDYYAKKIIETGYYLNNGVATKFEEGFSIDKMVGVKICTSFGNVSFNVAGIVKTDYEKYNFLNVEGSKVENTGTGSSVTFNPNDKLDSDRKSLMEKNSLCVLYMSEDCFKNNMARDQDYIFAYGNKMVLNNIEAKVNATCYNETKLDVNNSNTYIFTDEKIYNGVNNGFLINRGEIVLNLDMYNKAFGETDTIDNYIVNNISTNTINLTDKRPKHIGEQIVFEVKNSSNEILLSKTYIFKGLTISSGLNTSFGDFAYLNNENHAELMMKLRPYVSSYLVSGEYFNTNMYEILKTLRNYEVGLDSSFSERAYVKEDSFVELRKPFTIVSLAFLVISIIMFMNYISSTIADRQKDVGIIRSLGGTRGSIFKVFFTMSIIFFVLSNVLANIFYYIITPLYNNMLISSSLNPALSAGAMFIFANPLISIVVLGISFIATSLASLIPIILVSKKSPIEAIKDK